MTRQQKRKAERTAKKFQTSNNTWKMYRCENPYTGAVSILNQEQADMIKKIKTLEYEMNVVETDYTADNTKRCKMINEFDELRYEFAEKWSDIYMAQLD